MRALSPGRARSVGARLPTPLDHRCWLCSCFYNNYTLRPRRTRGGGVHSQFGARPISRGDAENAKNLKVQHPWSLPGRRTVLPPLVNAPRGVHSWNGGRTLWVGDGSDVAHPLQDSPSLAGWRGWQAACPFILLQAASLWHAELTLSGCPNTQPAPAWGSSPADRMDAGLC
jgi:hypothetical protein